MKLKLLQQVWRMTKLSLYGFLLQVLMYQFLSAEDVRAQRISSVHEVHINVNLQNANLEEVFAYIESKTDFSFSYNIEDISQQILINRIERQISVAALLEDISKQANLKFKQVNKNISVDKIKEVNQQEKILEVIIQTRNITGKVTSFEEGEGLPGVNVLEKGTSNGTVTNVNGQFNLTVNEGATLVFSSVGYTQEEVEVGSKSVIDLAMTQDIQQLQELVVVGYGTQKRADITGSISRVTEKEIENIPVTAIDAMLQGKVAGVQVVQNSGAPGAANFVRIRGSNSLFGENRPLYVVDGVPMNEVTTNVLNSGGQLTTGNNDINPNDIESIEILKDASATAIYGSRGSNGVILITTKRGKSGDAKVEFNMYTGVQEVWRKLDVLNASQYEDLIVESLTNENQFRADNGQSPLSIPDEIRDSGINTNWQDEIFRTAPISNYNLSITGGNEKTKYFTSVGYFDQKGTVKGQEFDRVNGRINIDQEVNEKFSLGSNLTLSYSRNDRIFSDFDGRNPIGAALIARPNLPVYNEDGSFSQDNLTQNFNPVKLTQDIPFTSTQKRVIGNVFAEYALFDNLVLRTTWGIDNLSDRQERFIPNNFVGIANAEAASSTYEELVWVIETTATYNKILNDNNDISIMIGNTLQQSEEYFLSAGGSQAGSNIIRTVNSISVPDLPGNRVSQWGLASYFGRLTYNFREKLLFTGTLRADGSSRFGEENRWGIFPSASVGYRLSKESFMQDINFINDIKFRASYGVIGNQEFNNDFPGRARYNTGDNYFGLPGVSIANIPNPNLQWESTSQTNIGVDITLFDNRVNLTADVYEKLTSDLIYQLNVPFTTGFFAAEFFNLGEVENRGIDLSFNTINLKGAFNWTSNFNINFNRNKIKSLPNFDPENPTASDFFIEQEGGFDTDGTRSVFRVGEPVGSFYGWMVDRIDPQTGGVTYVDTNNDGELGLDDRTVFGNAQPLHTGGFTNNFAYKDFYLNIFMQWSYGNEVYNQTQAVLQQMQGYNNQSTNVLNRWQQPGDQTQVPIATFNDVTDRFVPGANNTEISDRFLEDGSFLRVKDITLGYNLPNILTNNINISNVRIYGSVRNAFTFTNYTGFDPESQNTAAITSIGIDYLTQPVPRTYIFGVDIQF
ncbi:MAG: SusC/RagA family TonB-linked outer membrane protein [Cyclobacteriaceae bacterium]